MTPRWLSVAFVAVLGCEERAPSMSGQVIDSNTGRPVVGAVVMCAQPGFVPSEVTGTDQHGKFTLDGCPNGSVDVDVHAAGYSATTVSSRSDARGIVVRLTEGIGWKANGVGARLRLDGDRVLIDVVRGGPFAKAGIVDGTLLVAVDGQAAGRDLDALANRLRGASGTKVSVLVQGPGDAEPRAIMVNREEIVDD